MTLNGYISVIKNSGVIKKAKVDLLVEIFNATRTNEEATPLAAKKWLYNERSIRTGKYFADDKTNENGFYEYFKRRVRTRWREIQEAFKKTSVENIVNCDTDDMGIFYRSLFAQFLLIIELPLSKDMYEKMLHDTDSIDMSQSTSAQILPNDDILTPPVVNTIDEMLVVFSNLLYEHRIAKILITDIIEPSRDIKNFIEVAKSEILDRFTRLQNEKSYLKIREFILLINNYSKRQ